jgi:hypothetical protein
MDDIKIRDYADKEELFADDEPETCEVALSSGKVVEVRGLTRYELLLNGKNTDDSALIERRNVATCLVYPVLTLVEVERWQRSRGRGKISDFAKVTNAIRDLSGLGEGAAKSDVAEAGN